MSMSSENKTPSKVKTNNQQQFEEQAIQPFFSLQQCWKCWSCLASSVSLPDMLTNSACSRFCWATHKHQNYTVLLSLACSFFSQNLIKIANGNWACFWLEKKKGGDWPTSVKSPKFNDSHLLGICFEKDRSFKSGSPIPPFEAKSNMNNWNWLTLQL